MNETIGSGGALNTSQQEFFRVAAGVTNVHGYRESILQRHSIEYTIFFNKDGNKWRLDFEEKNSVFDAVYGDQAEWYLVGRIVEAINQGNYRDARTAIGI